MGIIINQSIRNAVISYTGIIIGFISTIVLFPNILGAERFGLTRTLMAIMVISVQLVNLGVPNSIIKFFPTLSRRTNNPPGLYWLFIIPPAVGLIFFILFFIGLKETILGFYSDSSLLSDYYYIIIPLVFSTASFGLLNSFISASFNTVFASFLQEILLRIIVIIDLILFYFEFISFDQFIIIFILNYTLQYIILFFYALKKGYLNFTPSPKPFDKLINRDISHYSFFAFFSGFTMIFVGNIDLIMVDIFEGLEKTGVYAIALYVGAVIAIPRRSISKISFPVISKAFKDNDLALVSTVYKQSSLNQLLIGLLIYIGVIANINNLYALLPDEYANGSIVIIVIGLANLFDIATGTNGQIIISSQYYRFDFISSAILVLISITLNILLIPIYGLTGAAIATASSISIYNIIKMIYVWVKFRMQPFVWRTFALILLGLIVFFLSTLLPPLINIYLDVFVRSVLMALIYMGAVWVFNLSEEVNNSIRKILKRI